MLMLYSSSQCPVGRDKSKRMKKRSGFKPPVKEKCTVSTTSSATYRIHTAISNSSQKHNTDQTKVCHTVLSYCDNDRTDDHGPFDMDTQPLSMFSGETEGEEAIGDLDGLLFQLDDPFSKSNDTQSSECSKLDDPLFKLDDPFSLSSDSLRIAQEKMIEFGSFDEQIVPASPQCKHSQADSEHETEVRVGSVETVPRRQFKVPQSRRCYNLDLLPKHYKKGIRKNRDDVRARSRPGVNSNVSVLVRNAEKEGMGGGGGGDRPMSVYEVPLSAGDHRERGKESRELRNAGRQSRANVSMSKLDLSLHSRTREEQVW